MTDTKTTSSATAAEQTQSKEEPQDDRTRVLRMVADGRITVDEAVELLKALQPEPAAQAPDQHTEHTWGPGQMFGPGARAWTRPFPGKWEHGAGPFAQRSEEHTS